jgi:hypothetical protein
MVAMEMLMAFPLESRVAAALDELNQKIKALAKRLDNQHDATQDLIRRVSALEQASQSAARKP